MEEPSGTRRSVAVWLATGLGVGLVVPAPGTFGAAMGAPIAYGVLHCPHPAPAWAAVVIALLAGVPLCDRAARNLGREDPGPVIWDEIFTVPLVFVFMPGGVSEIDLLLGFGLHRLFDISKPWPCRRLEKLPGGWGIMADDVMAALYAAVTLGIGHLLLLGKLW